MPSNMSKAMRAHRDKMMKFHVPTELKDDIVYCQRSLRSMIKLHQLLAAKLSLQLPQTMIMKLKRYLAEIEEEIIDITMEQAGLVATLDKSLKIFLERSSNIDEELANAYVSRMLSVTYETFCSRYLPQKVTERLSEVQLAQKYELSAFDEYSCKKEIESSPSPSGSSESRAPVNFPVKQVSLLKPLEERITSGSKHIQSVPEEECTKKIISVPPRVEVPPAPLIKEEPEANQAIKKSRNNLLQALSKAKSSATQEAQKPEVPQASLRSYGRRGQSNNTSPKSKGTAEVVPPSVPSPKSVQLRAASCDSPPVSRSSTPPSAKASDESFDLSMVDMLIDELPIPQPTDIYDMGQTAFMHMFGLYTLEESKILTTRKTERKRRSCYSTERKDFHYGKLDYYEQQRQAMQRRRNRRPILYSPPATRAIKKKRQIGPPSPGTSGTGTRATQSETQAKQTYSSTTDNNTCFVCNKSGSIETLFACIYCCNIYHLQCHTSPDSGTALTHLQQQEREDMCPPCLQSGRREIATTTSTTTSTARSRSSQQQTK